MMIVVAAPLTDFVRADRGGRRRPAVEHRHDTDEQDEAGHHHGVVRPPTEPTAGQLPHRDGCHTRVR